MAWLETVRDEAALRSFRSSPRRSLRGIDIVLDREPLRVPLGSPVRSQRPASRRVATSASIGSGSASFTTMDRTSLNPDMPPAHASNRPKRLTTWRNAWELWTQDMLRPCDVVKDNFDSSTCNAFSARCQKYKLLCRKRKVRVSKGVFGILLRDATQIRKRSLLVVSRRVIG
jgi:hypothetical protein